MLDAVHRRPQQAGGEICGLRDCDLSQKVDIGQHHPSSPHDRRARLFAVCYRQAGFFAEALIEVFQQGASAGEDDPFIDDIRGQLWGCLFKGVSDCIDDGGHDFGQGLTNFLVGDAKVFCTPSTRSRPLTSILNGSSSG